MSSRDCPFCSVQADRVLVEMEHVFGIWDLFPVSPGHALVIPKRHVSSWFDATPEERTALAEGTERVRDEIVALFSPDGFNIGINVGHK